MATQVFGERVEVRVPKRGSYPATLIARHTDALTGEVLRLAHDGSDFIVWHESAAGERLGSMYAYCTIGDAVRRYEERLAWLFPVDVDASIR